MPVRINHLNTLPTTNQVGQCCIWLLIGQRMWPFWSTCSQRTSANQWYWSKSLMDLGGKWAHCSFLFVPGPV